MVAGDDAPTLTIEVRDRYLFTKQTGRLRDVNDARDFQQAVEEAVVGTTIRLALFDNRETLPVQASIAKAMWRWHQSCGLFDRIAMLLMSVGHGRKVNMRAASSGTMFRAFSNEAHAVNWLHADSWIDAHLLVFESAGVIYATEAVSVAEVIPWQAPLQLPMLPACVFGVVEHRGRLHLVCRPDGQPVDEPPPEGSRFILFAREWGNLAVPAEKTHVAGNIQLARLPIHGNEIESSLGVLQFLDARRLADEVSATVAP